MAPDPPHLGLSSSDVEDRRARYGDNGKRTVPPPTVLTSAIEIAKEPMILLLIAALIIYLLIGQHAEALMMGIGIVIVTSISLYQERKSRMALDLLKSLTKRRVRVIRDGSERWIPADEIVVDDIIHLSEGEAVPADAEILSANDCAANEALLTGESLSVFKSERDDALLFQGTHIVGGQAYARVAAVGTDTRAGRLSIEYEHERRARSPLQIAVDRFVRVMALVGVALFVVIILAHWYQTGEIVHSLVTGLALTMSLLPEEIPVALSVFMALGARRLAEQGVLVREPQALETLAAVTTLCLDKTGTLTKNEMEVAAAIEFESETLTEPLPRTAADCSDSLRNLLSYAMWASEREPFDPMERAIHRQYEQVTIIDERPDFALIREYPLSGTPPSMTHIFEHPDGRRYGACKGAPEAVLHLAKLPEPTRTAFESRIRVLSQRGLRVLAVARAISSGPLPSSAEQLSFELLGVIGLRDPIRAEVAHALIRFSRAGVRPLMITGDAPETAQSVASEVGIQSGQEVCLGSDISRLDDAALEERIRTHAVFARISPENKLRIIKNLTAHGEIVAMTGDGVNDALALKAAHVGVAMGKRGTEIARQAASLTLLHDNLDTLADALENGRRVFDNLQKAIYYIIAIHIPIVGLVAVPVFLGLSGVEIFTPVHVIFLELIMGPTCSIVYESDPAEPTSMERGPRSLKKSFLTGPPLVFAILQGLVLLIVIGAWAILLSRAGADREELRTSAFVTLVLSNMLLTLVNRSQIESVLTTCRYRNPLVTGVLVISAILLAATLFTGSGRSLFGLELLEATTLLACLAVAMVGTLWFELVKWARRLQLTRS